MGVANLYYVHGILLPSGSLLSELTDARAEVNNEELVGYASGHPHPLFRAVRGQKPAVPFTCNAVGTVLAAVVAGGNNYALDLSAGNTDVQYKRGYNLGVRFSPAVAQHERLRMTAGFLLWDTIAAEHQQDATIACRLLAGYDGTNAPVQQVGTGSLTGAPAATQFYTLGPTKINGSWLTGEQNFSLSSGLETEEAGSGGETWDTYLGVRQANQVLTVTTLGKPWGNLGLAGTPISSLTQYLRAKTADGHNVADGSASHIAISATNGLVLPETADGGGADRAPSTLRLALRAADGNSDPLSINVASTIA